MTIGYLSTKAIILWGLLIFSYFFIWKKGGFSFLSQIPLIGGISSYLFIFLIVIVLAIFLGGVNVGGLRIFKR